MTACQIGKGRDVATMARRMNMPTANLRRLGAAVVLAAAALVGTGTFFPRWWTGEQGGASMAVGLRQAILCGERGCATSGLETLGTAQRTWALAGATGFAIGCVTTFFLALAAAMALARPAGGVWSGRVARAAAGLSLFALVVGIGFAWAYPGFAGLSLGPSPFLYLGGAALGVGGAGVLLGRRGSSAG
ncbi:MAG TPA: hypothetical protein VFU21_06575 [Kofleriaceae bacterium]|nr:hypothetical protein [Kofleriaceae bacterium]